jgi:hypothetical protein
MHAKSGKSISTTFEKLGSFANTSDVSKSVAVSNAPTLIEMVLDSAVPRCDEGDVAAFLGW